jgi:hypothetical protein
MSCHGIDTVYTFHDDSAHQPRLLGTDEQVDQILIMDDVR